MIRDFKGIQGCGKTAALVCKAHDLVHYHGYDWSECVGNVAINVAGYSFLSNDQLVDFIRQMCHAEFAHKIVLIDEVDGVFPHRFWNEKEQTMALLGIWQDEKLFNQVIMTSHLGKSIDKNLRDATQARCYPFYNRKRHYIKVIELDGRFMLKHIYYIKNLKYVFGLYDRWQVVKHAWFEN